MGAAKKILFLVIEKNYNLFFTHTALSSVRKFFKIEPKENIPKFIEISSWWTHVNPFVYYFCVHTVNGMTHISHQIDVKRNTDNAISALFINCFQLYRLSGIYVQYEV